MRCLERERDKLTFNVNRLTDELTHIRWMQLHTLHGLAGGGMLRTLKMRVLDWRHTTSRCGFLDGRLTCTAVF